MYQHALDKIRDEMAQKSSNPGIQFLGETMTGQLNVRPELAAQILQKDKTLEGAFGAIREYAGKHKTGNFAFVPPEKALEIMAGYWGFKFEKPEPQAPAEKTVPARIARPEPDDFDLDAMLDELGGL